MQGESLIEVGRQVPQLQRPLLQRARGGEAQRDLPCHLLDHQARPPRRSRQQFGAGAARWPPRLPGVQPPRLLPALVRLAAHPHSSNAGSRNARLGSSTRP
jgi:hypothetical protein